MVILGVGVFMAGLLLLYSAITDQAIADMFTSVLSGQRYPSVQTHN